MDAMIHAEQYVIACIETRSAQGADFGKSFFTRELQTSSPMHEFRFAQGANPEKRESY